jgi:hypothetical protein
VSATVYSSIHILAARPAVRVRPTTYLYLSLSITPDGNAPVDETSLTLTLTGDADDRRAFANALRAAADEIERWEPEQPAPEEGDLAAVPA